MDGHEEAYNESDWFIVQGSLSEISVLDHIYFTQEEKDSVRADYINRNIPENEREYYFERDKRGNLMHRIPELDEPQKLVVDSSARLLRWKENRLFDKWLRKFVG